MKMQFLRSPSPWAFSLVEVTLALGIVAFALVAILGLLPTGLKSIKNANEQAGAANVLNRIANSLREANSSDGVNYQWSFGNSTYTFTRGGPGGTINWTNLNLEGSVTGLDEAPRLSARLEILETPGSNNTAGRAVVSVAWSAASNPQWSAESSRWINAEGFLSSGIQFLPRE